MVQAATSVCMVIRGGDLIAPTSSLKTRLAVYEETQDALY